VIRRILDKLALVRQRGLMCFGSEDHRFELNSPLDEGVIQRFEDVHGIRLPDDYRAFLRLAGNGGAGPYYGLLSLDSWEDAVLEAPAGFLARPSPLRPDMRPVHEREDTANPASEDPLQGTIALVYQGCAYYALLIVTGAYRGRVVYINLDARGSSYFVHHPDFLSWYERWLDELLWGYEDSWFGWGFPGREPDLVEVLREESAPDLRSEALTTLDRLPELHSGTLDIVRTLLSDGSCRLRAQACGLLGKHRVARAAGDIAARLEDDDSAVRVAAVDALRKLPGTDWETAARRLLGDRSESAVFRALCLLMDAGRLRPADVMPLLRSRDEIVRGHALWALSAIEGEVIEAPDDL
jgi:hypothetical protein